MRLISINFLKEGMVIGRTIWDEVGHPILHKDVEVTTSSIERLRQLNLQYVYIEDSLLTGIFVEEIITPEKRLKVVKNITESFEKVKNVKSTQAPYLLVQQSKVIGSTVEDLLNAIISNEEVLTVLTDAYIYDEYLYQHSFQVTMYSITIAKEMGYSYDDLRIIGIGAMLHDIGKLLIPTEILQKTGRLTDGEYETMKQHARFGFDIIRNLHTLSLLVAQCAFQHHERLDGSGYPRGLVDFEIHPFAKIIGVADVFDAVTSNRVYRSKMLSSEGIAIIEADSGKMYDARVVEALKRSVIHYTNGTIIMLSDGRRGIVSKQNIHNLSHPWIRIFEEAGTLIMGTYEISLEEHPNLAVV